MNEKTEKEKNNRIDWNEAKTKFMIGEYKSLRDFAEKENFGYNGNFRRMTKGWTFEKGANREQIGCKIVEKITEEEIAQAVALNSKLQAVSELALNAAEDFFKNKDYQRFACKAEKFIMDEDGYYVRDKDGVHILTNDINIIETQFIQIDRVKCAVDAVKKISAIFNDTVYARLKDNSIATFGDC